MTKNIYLNFFIGNTLVWTEIILHNKNLDKKSVMKKIMKEFSLRHSPL